MRKMPVPQISDADEQKLWQKPLIVFDTSALCRLYSLTDDVRDDILVILEVLKEDIWIPNRVILEFERHREEELQKPLALYRKPNFLAKSHLSSELKDYIAKLENESYRHPKLESNTIGYLKKLSDELDSNLEKIRVTIESALKAGKEKVAENLCNDPIYAAIIDLECGDALYINELRSVIAEGHVRYSYKIPPGYMDAEEKSSVDVFGDLIIWKEVIKEAKKRDCPVIYVTQDLKEDWSAIESKDSIVPREELLVEFEAETGHAIWMYTISDFLTKLARFRAGVQALSEPLKNVDTLKMELEIASIPDDEIKIRCPHCHRVVGFSSDDFIWDWEWSGMDDREMGPEISYQCDEWIECPHCLGEINVNFSVYQYPIGVVNYVECDSDDSEILHKPDYLEDFVSLPDIDEEMVHCSRCGREYPKHYLDDCGFCPECVDEIDDYINSDD